MYRRMSPSKYYFADTLIIDIIVFESYQLLVNINVMTYTPQFFGKPDKKQLNQCCHEIVLHVLPYKHNNDDCNWVCNNSRTGAL